jgi:hypothetical protein
MLEGPQGEYRHSSNVSITPVLDVVDGQTIYPQEADDIPIVLKAGRATWTFWTEAENLDFTGI